MYGLQRALDVLLLINRVGDLQLGPPPIAIQLLLKMPYHEKIYHVRIVLD